MWSAARAIARHTKTATAWRKLEDLSRGRARAPIVCDSIVPLVIHLSPEAVCTKYKQRTSGAVASGDNHRCVMKRGTAGHLPCDNSDRPRTSLMLVAHGHAESKAAVFLVA